MFFKRDPGPCPVDDAPHTTCCAPGPGTVGGGIVAGKITPATTVIIPVSSASSAPEPPPAPPTRAEQVQAQLPTGQVTSGTYRRGKPNRPTSSS